MSQPNPPHGDVWCFLSPLFHPSSVLYPAYFLSPVGKRPTALSPLSSSVCSLYIRNQSTLRQPLSALLKRQTTPLRLKSLPPHVQKPRRFHKPHHPVKA